HAVPHEAVQDPQEGEVGVGDRLVQPVFLQEVLVLGMPDIGEVAVQDETEITSRLGGHRDPWVSEPGDVPLANSAASLACSRARRSRSARSSSGDRCPAKGGVGTNSSDRAGSGFRRRRNRTRIQRSSSRVDTPARGVCTTFERVIAWNRPVRATNPRSAQKDFSADQRRTYQLRASSPMSMSKVWWALVPSKWISETSKNRRTARAPCISVPSACWAWRRLSGVTSQ